MAVMLLEYMWDRVIPCSSALHQSPHETIRFMHLFCGIRPFDCSLALLRVQWPGQTVRMPESKSLSSISGWWCRVAVGTHSRQNQVKLEQQFHGQFLRAMSEALRTHRFGHSLNSDHLLKAPAVAIDQLDQRYEPIHSIRMACGDCGFTR